MPKIRGLKPETWTDDKFVELSPLARLLFLGMWNYACDNGHVEDKPTQLKMRVLPADACDVRELINEIADKGMVVRGDAYLTIPNLPLHQRIDKRYFTACEHCSETADTSGPQRAHDGDTSGARRAHALKEGRKDGDGDGDRSSHGDTTGKPVAKRATRLSQSFRPSEKHIELAQDLGVDLRAEWPKFCDHHTAKGSAFKDWGAALRNWIRRSAEYGGKAAPIRATPDEEGRLVLPPMPKGIFE